MSDGPLDIDALSDVPVTSRSMTLYFRHVYLPPPDQGDPDPLHTLGGPSRWRTPSGTLYAATSEIAAWAEYCRALGDVVSDADPTGGIGLTRGNFTELRRIELEVPGRALFGIRMRFDRVADLTTTAARAALRVAGFTTTEFFADDYGRCPAIAVAGESLGWDAIISPSAAWRRDDGMCVAVFDRAKPDRSQATRLRTVARPTVAVAYLTRYRSGGRPRWLLHNQADASR